MLWLHFDPLLEKTNQVWLFDPVFDTGWFDKMSIKEDRKDRKEASFTNKARKTKIN